MEEAGEAFADDAGSWYSIRDEEPRCTTWNKWMVDGVYELLLVLFSIETLVGVQHRSQPNAGAKVASIRVWTIFTNEGAK